MRSSAPYRVSVVDVFTPVLFVVTWVWVFTWDLDSALPVAAVASSDVTDTAAP